MSLLWSDSFANYDTATIGDMWTTPGGAIVATHVRTGTQSLRIQAGDAPSLTDISTINGLQEATLGAAFYFEALNGDLFTLVDGADRQVFLTLNPDGSITASTGTIPTVLGTTAPGVITAGTFWYIELQTLIDTGLTGYVKVQVTNLGTNVSTVVLNLTGIATSSTSIQFTGFSLGGPAGPDFAYVNDLYLADRAPFTPNNDFLGPVQIVYLSPISDGLQSPRVPLGTGWEPIGFPHFSLVNEIPPDGGVTKLQFDSTGADGTEAADGYNYDNTGISGTILSVVPVVDQAVTSGGAGQSGAYIQQIADTTQNTVNLTNQISGLADNTWRMIQRPQDINPITGLPWLISDLVDYQFGPYVALPI